MNNYTIDTLNFIDACHSPFHSVNEIKKILLKDGFKEILESSNYLIEKGKKYFITRNGTSIIAFKTGNFKGNDYSFNISASHTDSPTFKVKHNSKLITDDYNKLSVEAYGGMLCAPWLDRPLSLAGRVMINKDNKIENQLISFDRDLLLIPNVAIHMNRSANDGYKYNFAIDMQPLFTLDKDFSLEDLISEQLKIKKEDIIGHDLYLCNRVKGCIWGGKNEFVAANRLDDLECAYTTLIGFLKGNNDDAINVYCSFDNEEVGSRTRQGAASTFLFDTLKRINNALGLTEDDFYKAISSSFMVSADNAHAVHPNHPELSDQLNRVYMNKGIVIKFNAAQSYTSDGLSASYFKKMCDSAKVPYQIFTNRADLRGGGTLGNISTSQVSLMSVDIGLAQLAMHSSYECAGAKDIEYMINAMKEFYSHSIRVKENNDILIK